MKSHLMDFAAAAKLVGLSTRHFRRQYCEIDKQRFIQIGRKHFVVRVDVQLWLKGRSA